MSIPRGQTDTLSPHGRVTCPGMLARIQMQPPPSTYPALGRARGQQGQPRARGHSEWAVTAPCAGQLGREQGALLDVEEGSGRVRGHSWAGSGRDWRETGLGEH